MSKKKIIIPISILLIISFGLIVSQSSAMEKIYLYVNNEQLSASSVMIDNQVYAPVRLVADAFGAETRWDQDTKSVYIDSDIPLIASIPEETIRLYGFNKDDESNFYQSLILSINGVKKVFDWETAARIEDLPQLHYVDLNGDEKEELVVILSRGRGTGSLLRTIHVINPESLDEYELESPLDVIEDQVEITILSPKEAEIKIGGKITNVNLEDVDLLRPGVDKISSDIFYENYINYEITDSNILKATVGAEVESLAYLGFIEIDYSFQDGKFKADHIVFSTVSKK